MHHYEPECYVKNALLSSRSQCGIISFLLCLQHWWSLCNQTQPDCLVKISWIALFKVKFIMTVNKSLNICQSYIFCTTDLCNQNQCTALWKWIALFKVKFIMTVNKSLNICQSYIFCTTDLCNQNQCTDVLLLITRPSANKLDIRVDRNSDLQYLGTQRVVFRHARRQTVLTSNSVEIVLVLLSCMWVKYISTLKRAKLHLRWKLYGKMCKEEVQLSRPRPKSEIAQWHRKERWWYCLFYHWDA